MAAAAAVAPDITVQHTEQAAVAAQVHAVCAAILQALPAAAAVETQAIAIPLEAAETVAAAELAVILESHGATVQVMDMVAVEHLVAAAAAAARVMAAAGVDQVWCASSGVTVVAGPAVIHTTYRSSHNIINEE